MSVRFKTSTLVGSQLHIEDGWLLSINVWFCQNEGEVIESEDGKASYESEENQEQVSCYFLWRFCLRDCAIIQLGEGGCKKEGACPLLIRHLHQLNMFK